MQNTCWSMVIMTSLVAQQAELSGLTRATVVRPWHKLAHQTRAITPSSFVFISQEQRNEDSMTAVHRKRAGQSSDDRLSLC